MIKQVRDSALSAPGTEPGVPLRARVDWLKWAVLFGFWTFFSLLNANQVYFDMLHKPGMNHSWWRIVVWQLVVWYAWLCLTPVIIWLGCRLPLEGGGWLKGILAHLPVSAVISALHVAAATYFEITIQPFDVWSDKRPFLAQYESRLNSFFLFDFVMYWAILGVGYAFDYRTRLREREALAAQLRAQLAQAQLEALKMQLHPHFLFNTLHTISGLVRAGQKQPAVNMIAGLSDLLRRALDSADEQEVALRDEVKFTELYLDIQKVRFSDRLTVRVDASPEALDALVPNLLLQPLVENAVRHGVSLNERAGTVSITAYRAGGMLHVNVSDDGPGLQSGWRMEESEGIGLANTRARLERLYGERQRFELRNDERGGVTASVAIPFRAADYAASIV